MDLSYEDVRPHGHCHGNTCDDRNEAPMMVNQAASSEPESFILDNIIVGYAFGPKKMETMGLIMAEASKALSTFECAGNLSSLINQQKGNQRPMQQNRDGPLQMLEDASVATTAGAASILTSQAIRESSNDRAEKGSLAPTHYFSENEDDTRSLSSTYTRASFMSQRSQRGAGGSNNINGIQLTFMPDASGAIHLVRTASSGGGPSEGESITGSSVTTSATNPASFRRRGVSSMSCASMPMSMSSSLSKEMADAPHAGSVSPTGRQQCQVSPRHNYGSGCRNSVQRHPIRVSFVPIDMDTPLEEQHGGKFDVILHKMTEDILCMSKMLRSRGLSSADVEGGGDDLLRGEGGQAPSDEAGANEANGDSHLFDATPAMTRHQARASRRIQRLREYKERVQPSCVLVDSPNDILAVMSRADMAEVLSRCLAGVATKGGIPVRTPRFRVVDEESILEVGGSGKMKQQRPTLADEIDNSGFEYPLIAKPLTAAGTKSSHHMGIVLARDGLQRLKTPCLLQEYANHGEQLFKVYVLGESVWVFSRESLPNLPLGENQMTDDADCPGISCGDGGKPLRSPRKRPRTESYVEFERPAGSRCYVEFNSQRPYPKLSDFGISSEADRASSTDSQDDTKAESSSTQTCKLQQQQQLNEVLHTDTRPRKRQRLTRPIRSNCDDEQLQTSDLARHVTKEEIEPVTAALREAFGLDLFGFDVLVKHDPNSPSEMDDAKEIFVVDVNYFPGYKEVPHFPSLLAQYLTQKAVESRLRNIDGS